MFAVRVHGHGGHEVTTAASMLSVAAFVHGGYGRTLPGLDQERAAEPAVAFCRIDGRPILAWEPVVAPDVLIIQDEDLAHRDDVFDGLRPDGYALINSARDLADLRLADRARQLAPGHILTVPASSIARRHLGRRHPGRPSPNAALLGAFAALTGTLTLADVETTVWARFSGRLADANVEAAREAFASLRRARPRVADLVRE